MRIPSCFNFYQNPKKFAFQTQIFFLLRRYNQASEMAQMDLFNRTTMSDFLFDKDRIFARVNLNDNDYWLYDQLFGMLKKRIRPPDLVIFLQSKTDVLMERIRRRNRKYEKSVSSKYLERINQAFNEFFFHYADSPLLVVNASEIDFVRVPEDFEDLVTHIGTMKSGIQYYVPVSSRRVNLRWHMEVIEKMDLIQKKAEDLRLAGKVLGFVPTMGFFHEGHLELMRVAKRHSDVVIISIFVNPIQFGPTEDFESYPRNIPGDLEKARQVGVDIAFLPSVEEMYPEGFQTRVSAEKVTKHLCGLSRPTHFDGVTTIVAKLFNITKPHLAVFGQKDYQQLTVISRMVKDLNMDIRSWGCPPIGNRTAWP